MKMKIEIESDDAKRLFGRLLAEKLLPGQGLEVTEMSWRQYSGVEMTLEAAAVPSLRPLPIVNMQAEEPFPNITPPNQVEDDIPY